MPSPRKGETIAEYRKRCKQYARDKRAKKREDDRAERLKARKPQRGNRPRPKPNRQIAEMVPDVRRDDVVLGDGTTLQEIVREIDNTARGMQSKDIDHNRLYTLVCVYDKLLTGIQRGRDMATAQDLKKVCLYVEPFLNDEALAGLKQLVEDIETRRGW